MGKREREQPQRVLVKAVFLTVALYLALQLLLTLCVLNQVVPEDRCLLFIAAAAVLAPLLGGLYCARALSWNRWLSSLANAAVFAAILAAAGAFCEGGINWKGSGGRLLACILGGGLLAGLLGFGSGRKKRRRR